MYDAVAEKYKLQKTQPSKASAGLLNSLELKELSL
jgi:hypothetical protein